MINVINISSQSKTCFRNVTELQNEELIKCYAFPSGNLQNFTSALHLSNANGMNMNTPPNVFAIDKKQNSSETLFALNERLNLALESTGQIVFDWSVADDKLQFNSGNANNAQKISIDITRIWRFIELFSLIHKEDRTDFKRLLHATLKGNDGNDTILHAELRMLDKQCEWHWMAIRGKVVQRDDQNHALRMVGTFTDIESCKQQKAQVCPAPDLFSIGMDTVPVHFQNAASTAFIRNLSDVHHNQAASQESAVRYRQIIEMSQEAIFVHRNGKLVLVNQVGRSLLGISTPDALIDQEILNFVHPDYHAACTEQIQLLQSGLAVMPLHEQVWIRSDGRNFYAETTVNRVAHDDTQLLQTIVRDISIRKRAEQLQIGQSRIFQLIATGAALPTVLDEITLFMDAHLHCSIASILLRSQDGTTLSPVAGQNLPETYRDKIDGVPVAASGISCSAAVFRSEPVIVADIANSPVWTKHRAVALQLGLHACASWPIIDKSRKAIGTVAIYFRDKKEP